jgi:hypothetical protein
MISKALEKDRELRYQHASEIRTDLKRLLRDSDSGRSAAVGERYSPPAAPPQIGDAAGPGADLRRRNADIDSGPASAAPAAPRKPRSYLEALRGARSSEDGELKLAKAR